MALGFPERVGRSGRCVDAAPSQPLLLLSTPFAAAAAPPASDGGGGGGVTLVFAFVEVCTAVQNELRPPPPPLGVERGLVRLTNTVPPMPCVLPAVHRWLLIDSVGAGEDVGKPEAMASELGGGAEAANVVAVVVVVADVIGGVLQRVVLRMRRSPLLLFGDSTPTNALTAPLKASELLLELTPLPLLPVLVPVVVVVAACSTAVSAGSCGVSKAVLFWLLSPKKCISCSAGLVRVWCDTLRFS
jgi:hypothetical protein